MALLRYVYRLRRSPRFIHQDMERIRKERYMKELEDQIRIKKEREDEDRLKLLAEELKVCGNSQGMKTISFLIERLGDIAVQSLWEGGRRRSLAR